MGHGRVPSSERSPLKCGADALQSAESRCLEFPEVFFRVGCSYHSHLFPPRCG